MEGLKQLLINIPVSLYRSLKVHAAIREVTMKSIIVTALSEYLDRNRDTDIDYLSK